MISRPAKIALSVVAFGLGVVTLGAGLFAWRLMSGGPVSLGPLVQRIEATINSNLKDVQVDLGDGVVEFTKDPPMKIFH